jgi:hypothetical protein
VSGQPSDVVERLIASLEADAEMIDHGEFTIDQGKARDKLRDYQLADADAWVLLVVELAALLGARAVYFDYTEPGQTQVRFRSRGFEREQLAEPLSGVFAARDGASPAERSRRTAWQKLAIACSALLGRATMIELACLDAEGKGARMLWTGDPEGKVELDEIERDADQAGNHLRVALEDRGHVERETELLRRACRFSSLLVMAGSETVSRGWKAMFAEPEATTPIRDEDFRSLGLAAQVRSNTLAQLCIQTNGVLAEYVLLKGFRPGFSAIADLDLTRDLAQRQVLRDAAYERMLALVRATHDQMAALDE